jgi:hypothetical protein
MLSLRPTRQEGQGKQTTALSLFHLLWLSSPHFFTKFSIDYRDLVWFSLLSSGFHFSPFTKSTILEIFSLLMMLFLKENPFFLLVKLKLNVLFDVCQERGRQKMWKLVSVFACVRIKFADVRKT